MIILKKSEIEKVLLILSATKDGKIIGLLHEKITLGTKRKLQKIFNCLLKEYELLQEHIKECAKSENKENELSELLEEIIKCDCDKISILNIETVETDSNYDFEMIEKISE